MRKESLMETAMADDGNTRSYHLLAAPELPPEPKLSPDPLLALYGSGKYLWSDEHADEYVARLRGGWD